jgi:hypothetical protein
MRASADGDRERVLSLMAEDVVFLVPGPEVSEAVVGDSVRASGTRTKIAGWGLRARLVRARIIKDTFLK